MRNVFILLFILPLYLKAQDSSSPQIPKERCNGWSLHFQQTVVGQGHNKFNAPYGALHSFQPKEDWHYSLTTTLYIGCRLWKGGELYFNPEMAGGSGLSSTFGIGGFPNGETFRVGNPAPALYIARGFLRQHFALSKNEIDTTEDEANSISGLLPKQRITLTVGKLSIADIFDNNTYSHDPRTSFLNWGLMSAGGWDYPANTRGYTYAFVAELYQKSWALRAATAMVPEVANGPFMDMHFDKAHSETVEFEKRIKIKRPGKIRLLLFHTTARMGNYKESTSDTSYHLSVDENNKYGRSKFGFAINAEQETGKYSGMFLRLSWNDGHNETWAFTEIDQSLSIGYTLKGNAWRRNDDRLGIAILTNGLSPDHQAYLKAGGYGFMLGDGKLNYSQEFIIEAQYSIALSDKIFLSPDYQFIMNPGYNKDRGPVHVFGVRGHIEF